MLFDRPPQLSGVERRRVFDLPVAVWSAANDIQSVSGKIGFLVSAGYFRSARRFFLASDFHDHDIAYVAARLGIGANGFDQRGLFRTQPATAAAANFGTGGVSSI